jgi:O-antigen ligase
MKILIGKNISFLNRNILLIFIILLVFFMILFLGRSLSTLTSTNRLFYSSIILSFVILKLQNFKSYVLPERFLTYIYFALLACISIFYAKDYELTVDEIVPILTVVILFVSFYNLLVLKKSVQFLIWIYLGILSVYSFYLLFLISFDVTKFRFLPKSYNSIAIEFFLGFIFSIVLGILNNNKKFYYWSVYFALFVFATASVKVITSLVFLVFMCLIYHFIFNYKFSSKINFKISFKRIFILVILAFTVYGIAVSGMLDRSTRRAVNTILLLVFNDSQYQAGAAGSVELRGLFFEKGIKYWLESPFFGHGLNNYRFLFNEDYGTFTYSHSTPLELLVGLGIIGFGLFYFFLFILFRMGVIQFWKDKNFLNYFLVVALGCFVLIGLGQRIYSEYVFFVFLSVYYILIDGIYPIKNSYE